MKSVVVLAILGFLAISEAYPSEGQHKIQNKLGCAEGESYCDKYVRQGEGRGIALFLILSDELDPFRTCWEFEKKADSKDLFAIRKCQGTRKYIHPDYDHRNWVRPNWVELRDERTWWKLTPAGGDTYIITSAYGCNERGEGPWPCGKELLFYKASVQFGAYWLAVEGKSGYGTKWRII